MRSVRPILTLAASIAAFAALPAAADDGRRHVMTPLQKIDLVRDLPDEPAFERDGQYFDLGYIYPIHTVNGASVASSGGDAGFVLFHDDRYVRVDGALMADLRYALGDDPTQGYTPPTPASASRAPAADPWGTNGSADDARGQPVAAQPVRSSSGRRRGSIVATIFIMFLLLFLRVRGFRDLVIGGTLAAIAAIARRRAEREVGPAPAGPIETAATHAAAQRARLDALSGTSSSTAAPGGFGRKVV
ncbi:hypothetical protein [Sphingomonas panacisoli]|nr:hypothetical protein [Sphingomonas panacisoli]